MQQRKHRDYLEAKIKQLEGVIATARIVDESEIDTSKVSILTKVTLTNIATKKAGYLPDCFRKRSRS